MHFLRLTAAAAAMMTALPLLMPVTAFAETETAEETVIEPIYEPDQPYAADLHLSVSGEIPCRMQIVQHSPEADALMVCHAELPAQTGQYVISLEPGDYTVSVSASPLSDGAMPLTEAQDFTVENPDFSEKLDYTHYRLSADFSLIGSDTYPEASASALKKALKDGIRTMTQAMQFPYYENRIAGDYDGDGTVTAYDSSRVLFDFALAIAEYEEDERPSSKEQIYACDIDGNGSLDAYDSSKILHYFSLDVAGFDPEWAMVLKR